MKMNYFIIRLLVFGGLAFYLISCKNRKNPKQEENYISKTGDTVKIRAFFMS
jgi:hypothetical protein